MKYQFDVLTIRDPDGHRKELRLKGDWLFFRISSGAHSGLGEASHSGDDRACVKAAENLFRENLAEFELSHPGIKNLEQGEFASAGSLIEATAISGLNQALYDLLARMEGIPVWQLFVSKPVHAQLPFYATINRALPDHGMGSHLAAVDKAVNLGIQHIKCAPFSSVQPGDDRDAQLIAAQNGLTILGEIRDKNPDLGLRVDFHNRFHLDSFLRILPQLEKLNLEWIEEPCQRIADFKTIRERAPIPLAAGELFFGSRRFEELIEMDAVDIIMPDVKHVGGFGPLLEVCELADRHGVKVSPHNPSGPVSTMASLHAAGISSAVSSLEVPLLSTGKLPVEPSMIESGKLLLPSSPGWGIEV